MKIEPADENHSGHVTLYLPKDLNQWLAEHHDSSGIPFPGIVLNAISWAVTENRLTQIFASDDSPIPAHDIFGWPLALPKTARGVEPETRQMRFRKDRMQVIISLAHTYTADNRNAFFVNVLTAYRDHQIRGQVRPLIRRDSVVRRPRATNLQGRNRSMTTGNRFIGVVSPPRDGSPEQVDQAAVPAAAPAPAPAQTPALESGTSGDAGENAEKKTGRKVQLHTQQPEDLKNAVAKAAAYLSFTTGKKVSMTDFVERALRVYLAQLPEAARGDYLD